MNGEKKNPHKNLRVYSTKCTQYIHVGCHKLKLPKTFIPIKHKLPPSAHPNEEKHNYTNLKKEEALMKTYTLLHTHTNASAHHTQSHWHHHHSDYPVWVKKWLTNLSLWCFRGGHSAEGESDKTESTSHWMFACVRSFGLISYLPTIVLCLGVCPLHTLFPSPTVATWITAPFQCRRLSAT